MRPLIVFKNEHPSRICDPPMTAAEDPTCLCRENILSLDNSFRQFIHSCRHPARHPGHRPHAGAQVNGSAAGGAQPNQQKIVLSIDLYHMAKNSKNWASEK